MQSPLYLFSVIFILVFSQAIQNIGVYGAWMLEIEHVELDFSSKDSNESEEEEVKKEKDDHIRFSMLNTNLFSFSKSYMPSRNHLICLGMVLEITTPPPEVYFLSFS